MVDAIRVTPKNRAVLFSRTVLSALVAAVLLVNAEESAAKDQEFHLDRADARTVALAGEFNHWQAQPMSKQPDGTWSLTIPLAPGTYGYKFLVNGSEWLFDPNNPSRKTVDGIENSAIEISSSDDRLPASSATASPNFPAGGGSSASQVAPSPSLGQVGTILSSTPPPGLALTPGEELVTEIRLSPANRALAAREGNAALTTARLALVVPPGFDPAKSWPILVINNTENYSNVDAMNQFKDATIAEGWIIMGADPIESEKDAHGNWRSPCSVAGLDYLAAVWPGAANWPVACGGMSGGAKNSAFVAGEVVKAHHPLIGMLMMGCNQDMASVELRKGSPPQFLAVPIFLSSGTADTIATPAQTEEVKESMRRTGFRKVRLETHDGAHVVCQPHVGEALRWFVATSNPGAQIPDSFGLRQVLQEDVAISRVTLQEPIVAARRD